MLRFSKVGVAMVLMALCGLMAGSAGAVEWHTNGHKSATSTNAGAIRLVVHGSGGPVLIECASATFSMTLRGPTLSTASGIGNVTPVFGGPCTVSGTPGFNMSCSSGALVNGISYSGGTTFATAGGGVTTEALPSFDCTTGAAGTQCSTMTGTLHAHYINPATLNSSSPGTLTVTGVGQALTVTKIGAGCAAIPNGVGTFGKPGAGSTVTDATFIFDGPNAPWMFRTP